MQRDVRDQRNYDFKKKMCIVKTLWIYMADNNLFLIYAFSNH